MAIYHYQLKTVSRSTGRSATAAAAYRSGQAITDERTGQVFDYSKRSGVMLAEVVMPDGQPADREALWNAAETAEKRINSVVAREIVVALPHELNAEQQQVLVKGYAQGLSERTGWAVDVAIHEPGREGDLRNVHAHLLCSTRNVSRDPAGLPVMEQKTREWDVRSSGAELIRSERSEWERCVNVSLEQAQRIERVDCRSHAEKETGLEPQIHLGVMVTGMERKGMQTERGDEYRRIAAHNAQVVELGRVREQKAEQQEWECKLEAMHTLPMDRFRQERERYRPLSLAQMVTQDPRVQAAEEVLEQRAKAEQVKQQERGNWAYTLRQNEVKQSRFREEHPRLSWFHDHGFFTTEALSVMEKEHNGIEKALGKTGAELKHAEQMRAKAAFDVKTERENVTPGYYMARERQMVRFKEIEAIYEPRREQELAQKRELEQQQSRERGGGRSISMGW